MGAWSRIAPVLGGLGLLYLASQFVRNALGVISGDIEAALNLHATGTAILAGSMLLSYGLAQIPAAVLLRRAGVRRVLPGAGALLTVSLAGFALADSYLGLLFWRVVMGIATAPVLAASYAIYLGFGDQRFSLLSGYQTGFGRAGVVASTAPLALAVAAVGWREAFLWAAGASALAAVAATVVALYTAATAGAERDTSDPGVFRTLAKTPLMRAAVVFQGVNSAIGSAILGLWGGPWLTAAYGMEVRERGLMLLAMALAWAISAPLWGAVADRAKQPTAWLAGAAVTTVALLLAGAVWPLPVPAALAGMALLGAATGGYPVVLKLVRDAAPRGAIVYVATALTAGTMVLVFMVQLGTGLLVDTFGGTPGHRPVEAFQAVFGLLAVLMAGATVALIVSARRETV